MFGKYWDLKKEGSEAIEIMEVKIGKIRKLQSEIDALKMEWRKIHNLKKDEFEKSDEISEKFLELSHEMNFVECVWEEKTLELENLLQN